MSQFSVLHKDVGKRLDIFIVDKLKNISRKMVKDLLDNGKVKVNGKRVVIAKWEMEAGDSVSIRLEGVNLNRKPITEKSSKNEARSARKEPKKKESIGLRHKSKKHKSGQDQILRPRKNFVDVVYEDTDILVVEKPSGVVVQRGNQMRDDKTFTDILKNYLKRKYKVKGVFIKPVHRLDRDTSGLMVYAKSKVGSGLIQQFKDHKIQRAYLAIVQGSVDQSQGRINFPIIKGEFGHGRKVSVDRSGKDGSKAVTDYLVKERYKNVTLVRLDLKSGRTHQARVHMAAINHPIVGDRIYGREGSVKFPRHALHSHALVFKHPATGVSMTFTSSLPDDMSNLVDALRSA